MSLIFIVFAVLLVVKAQAGPVPNSGEEQTSFDPPTHLGNIDEMGPYEGGDMRLDANQLMESKQGVLRSSLRWPKGYIPITIDDSFTRSEKQVIYDALGEIQTKTCIQFFIRSSSANYVNVTRGEPESGCWSDVGRVGGAQQLNLEPDCVTKGTVAHEFIHAIGYYHEQSRPDRDDFVRINTANIRSGKEHNFDRYSRRTVGTFDVPYDLGSIMHYSAYAFSRNKKPTIEPVQSGVSLSALGQRRGLSEYDAEKINNMYDGVCESTS